MSDFECLNILMEQQHNIKFIHTKNKYNIEVTTHNLTYIIQQNIEISQTYTNGITYKTRLLYQINTIFKYYFVFK